jgi:hypothetical protein
MRLPQLAQPVLRTRAGAQVIAAVQHSSVGGACISVTVNNGKVCLNVPVVGSVCIPVPKFIQDGTAASACIDVCTKMGVPTGACVSVTVLGEQIENQCFGWC